jgi:hypothetical protein
MRILGKFLTGVLVLLAAVVAAKFWLEDAAGPMSSGVSGEIRRAPVDLLFVGSSHTRQSYDVHELEGLTGRTAFLVAYNGLDYRWMAEVVPALLSDPVRRPKVLVLEGYAMSLVRPPGLEDSRLFFDSPPRLKARLLRRVLAEGHGLAPLEDAFDLLANRDNELVLTFPVQSRFVNSLSYNGGYVGKSAAGLSSFEGLALPDEGSIPEGAQLNALGQIIAGSRSIGVRVVCMGSPMPGPVEHMPAVASLKASLRRLLDAEGVPYFDGAEGFPIDNPALFADSNHLSSAGRDLYSRRSAAFLLKLLSGGVSGPDRGQGQARSAAAGL